MTRTILLAGLLVIGVAGSALAQEHPEHPQQAATKSAAIEATLTGENFCLGCTLQKEKGAAAQCSKHGHRHALKVMSAAAAGKEMPQWKGWVLHYLETDQGLPLIREHHGETLTLKGKVYGEERVVEVVKLEGSKQPAGSSKKSEHPEHPNK